MSANGEGVDYLWTDAEFERMSWHDNHVHALHIVEGEHGAGELLLDLDYILEWVCVPDARARFRILPATLRFLDVSGLRIELDYAQATAALVPFCLDRIERRVERRERHEAQVWTLVINWPLGEISFEASGFEQRGSGAPLMCDEQRLPAAKRGKGN